MAVVDVSLSKAAHWWLNSAETEEEKQREARQLVKGFGSLPVAGGMSMLVDGTWGVAGAAAWWWWPGGVVDGGREGQRDREGEAGEWGGRVCVSVWCCRESREEGFVI